MVVIGAVRSTDSPTPLSPTQLITYNYNYYPRSGLALVKTLKSNPLLSSNYQRDVNERWNLTEVDAYRCLATHPDGRIEMGQSVGRPEGELYIASRSLRYKCLVWRHQKIYKPTCHHWMQVKKNKRTKLIICENQNEDCPRTNNGTYWQSMILARASIVMHAKVMTKTGSYT